MNLLEPQMLRKAFSYKQWADERTIAAVAAIDKSAQTRGYSFSLQQVNHMVIVEELFASRLEGRSPPHLSTNTEAIPEYDELAQRLGISNDWYSNYVSSLDAQDKQISFEFADGRRGTMSIIEILFHILTHGSYHRGNIAHALDLASVPHPIDGYGIYIHEKEPQRRDF